MKKILIIEDDQKVALALEIRFKTNGYETVRARDAVTGANLALSAIPDLIILDISLPDGNGLHLAEQFKRQPETRSTPIIFVTASKEPALRQRAMEMRIAGLIDKPYDPEELLGIARFALGESGSFSWQPATPAAPRESDHPARQIHGALGENPQCQMNILIVDDIATNRKLLRSLLEAAGLKIFEAADGLEALALLEREKVDAIVSDLLMPHMDGYRLCLELRQSEKFYKVPLIVYSSTYISPSDQKAALDLGADKVLKKPSRASEIVQALQEAVENASHRQPKVGGPIQELELMKEYNERLVVELETKNVELQRQTESLQKSESHKTAILESGVDCIIAMDHQGRILEFNAAAEKTFGFTRAEVLGWEMAELIIPPSLRKQHREGLERAAAGSQEAVHGGRLEMTALRKDGTEFPVEQTITRIGGWEPPMFAAFVRDISERKLAEQQVLLQATALGTAADAIIITDRQGTILWVNASFTTLTGYSAEEAISNNPRLLKSGAHDAAFYRRLWETILSGQTWRGEFKNRRKDGSFYDDEHTITPVRSGGEAVTHFIGIMHDVTARHHAEEELRLAHETLRQLLAHSPAVIYRLKLQGQNVIPYVVSDNIIGLLGFTKEETLRYEWWVEQLHPEDRDRALAGLSETLDHGTSCTQYRIRHRDGHYVWVEDNRRLTSECDQPVEMVGVWTDITERKTAESKLEAAHQQLLNASRHAGMAEVATNILHNVGNVLNSVNVSATLLVDNVKKSEARSLARVVALLEEHKCDLGTFITIDPRGQHLPAYLAQLSEHLIADQTATLNELDELRKNIEHIKEIVTMQQSYAKVSGLKEIINVTDLVEDSLRLNADALHRHCVEIVREFDDVPAINIEKHKVLQILVNLVRNARYACDDSGRTDKRLTVRVTQAEDRLKVSIIDNGVGIPPENLTRIFNHGFSTRKDGHGFGLHSGGLAAQEMGGNLTAQSDGSGQGATFTLELPLADSALSV